jgi:hypothetical protein
MLGMARPGAATVTREDPPKENKPLAAVNCQAAVAHCMATDCHPNLYGD